jgi:hypothetical protein
MENSITVSLSIEETIFPVPPEQCSACNCTLDFLELCVGTFLKKTKCLFGQVQYRSWLRPTLHAGRSRVRFAMR